MRALRMFVADSAGEWAELTAGTSPVVLDVEIAVADDSRTALSAISNLADDSTVQYAGTVEGLAGLVADLYVTGVADGVTLIPLTPDGDVRAHAQDALARVRHWLRISAA